MTEKVRRQILILWKHGDIDLMDLPTVQREALKLKMYDLVVFINKDWEKYIAFVKQRK